MLIQKIGLIVVGISLVFVSETFATGVPSCPGGFLASQPSEQRAQFLVCHEDPEGVYALRRVDEFRIDLQYFKKAGDSFPKEPDATLKGLGSEILTINPEKLRFLYQDINADSKSEFVFRVRFERGASLIGARYENKQFHMVGFFPTAETAGIPNKFLVHSDNSDIQIKNGKISVALDNTEEGQTTSRNGTYQLRKDGTYYLAEIK